MKIIAIIAIVLIFIFVALVFAGKKNIAENIQNAKCLTMENFFLIQDSQHSDELSKYTIWRKKNELRFTRKGQGYTLFFLKLETGEASNVKLIGLDGYGIRDKEFLKYTCNLIKSITEKENETN